MAVFPAGFSAAGGALHEQRLCSCCTAWGWTRGSSGTGIRGAPAEVKTSSAAWAHVAAPWRGEAGAALEHRLLLLAWACCADPGLALRTQLPGLSSQLPYCPWAAALWRCWDWGWPCSLSAGLLCPSWGAAGLCPVLGRSLPSLTWEVSSPSRCSHYQLKWALNMPGHREVILHRRYGSTVELLTHSGADTKCLWTEWKGCSQGKIRANTASRLWSLWKVGVQIVGIIVGVQIWRYHNVPGLLLFRGRLFATVRDPELDRYLSGQHNPSCVLNVRLFKCLGDSRALMVLNALELTLKKCYKTLSLLLLYYSQYSSFSNSNWIYFFPPATNG